jgi:hypothetical protein
LGGESFKLSLDVTVKVSLIVMWSTGTNARCSRQYRGDWHRWKNNMSFLGEEWPLIIQVSKDEEPIGSDDGVWKWFWSTYSTSRLASYLVDDMTLWIWCLELFSMTCPGFSEERWKAHARVFRW